MPNKIYNFIKYYIKKIIQEDQNNWSIFFFKNKPEDLILKKANKLKLLNIFKPPKDQFWADFFFFYYKKKKYIFFEKFIKKENKGIISAILLKKNKIYKITDVLKKNYHLSYPCLFKHQKNIYLIPESAENKRLEIYKSVKFPNKWKLIKTHFKNEIIADATIFKFKGSLWLFVNKTKKNLLDLNRKLYLYKISNDFNKIIPHKKNPIKNSFYGGRSGGRLFNAENKLIRPAQIQKKNIYGYGLVFYEIKKLSLNVYNEKEILQLNPSFLKKNRGIHHISTSKNEIVFDVNLIKHI